MRVCFTSSRCCTCPGRHKDSSSADRAMLLLDSNWCPQALALWPYDAELLVMLAGAGCGRNGYSM